MLSNDYGSSTFVCFSGAWLAEKSWDPQKRGNSDWVKRWKENLALRHIEANPTLNYLRIQWRFPVSLKFCPNSSSNTKHNPSVLLPLSQSNYLKSNFRPLSTQTAIMTNSLDQLKATGTVSIHFRLRSYRKCSVNFFQLSRCETQLHKLSASMIIMLTDLSPLDCCQRLW